MQVSMDRNLLLTVSLSTLEFAYTICATSAHDVVKLSGQGQVHV